MHRYRVIGYDAKGERLFTLRVEALTKTDARLMAMALLRRSGSGAALANRAEKLIVRHDGADERQRARRKVAPHTNSQGERQTN